MRRTILHYPVGLDVTTQVLVRGKQEAPGEKERPEGTPLLAVEMVEGATSQEMQAASRSGKGKEPERAPGRNTALQRPWF